MTTVTELEADIALRLHDTGNSELTTAQLLLLINQAVRWARNSGVLIPLEENESLTEIANTYTYAVPAGFAYVNRIIRQNTVTGTYDGYNTWTGDSGVWRIAKDGGVPTFFFDSDRYIPDAGALLKVVGQARPTIYTAGSDTVDVGLENMLLERALFFGFQFVAAGRSEYAQWRQQETLLARAESELALARAPQEFRMKQGSRYVPGR